jgi:hypothetical protein
MYPDKWEIRSQGSAREAGSTARLICLVCGYKEPVPRHCGIPMLYATTSYTPISPLTEKEIEEYRKYYNNKG